MNFVHQFLQCDYNVTTGLADVGILVSKHGQSSFDDETPFSVSRDTAQVEKTLYLSPS